MSFCTSASDSTFMQAIRAIYKVKHKNMSLGKSEKAHSFSVKMHQKSFGIRALPEPAGGANSAPQAWT